MPMILALRPSGFIRGQRLYLLERLGLSSHDLVTASTEQLTHKMVARACKGRWLTPAVQKKVQRAVCTAASQQFELAELFSYGPGSTGERSASGEGADQASQQQPEESRPQGAEEHRGQPEQA